MTYNQSLKQMYGSLIADRLINKTQKNKKRKGMIKMIKTNKNILGELEVSTELNGWGNITTYYTSIGSFSVRRKDELNYYGNPVYIITPLGYINELPPIKYFRRNNDKQHYTTTSYNIDETMLQFLTELNNQILKGYRLYHNI